MVALLLCRPADIVRSDFPQTALAVQTPARALLSFRDSEIEEREERERRETERDIVN